MKKVLIGGAIGCAFLVAAALAVLMALAVLGSAGPETSVVTGQQMRPEYAEAARELGLVDEGEKIVFFYSDAMFDVRSGMYLVTQDKLSLYSEDWQDTTLVAPLASVVDLDAEFVDTVFADSWFTVTLSDGDTWSFPVSTERGMDHRFYEHIEERMQRATELEDSATESDEATGE